MKDESKKTSSGRSVFTLANVSGFCVLVASGIGLYQVREQQRGRELAAGWQVAMWFLLGSAVALFVIFVVKLRKMKRQGSEKEVKTEDPRAQ